MSPQEKEVFRVVLEKQRQEASKLFKLNSRLLRLFRCACEAGEPLRTGFLPLSLLLRMCVRCCLVADEGNVEMNDDLLTPGITALKEQHEDAKKWAAADVTQLSAVVRMMDRTLELNAVEDANKSATLWSRKKNETAINGLTHRRLHNSVAVHHLLNRLSDSNLYRQEIRTITSASLQEMFAEVVPEGRDKCTYEEFVALIILLSRHFFTEEEQDHSFVYCVDCLWKNYLSSFVDEYTCNGVLEAVSRAPLCRFPGMDTVTEQFDAILEALFKLFGVAQRIRLANIQEMLSQSGVLAEFPHVTLDDVQSVFLEAKRLGTSAAALLRAKFGNEEDDDDEVKKNRLRLIAASKNRLELARDELDFFSFVDCLSLLSVVCLAVEPRCSDYPTMASKLEYLLLRLEPLYTDLVGISMSDHIRPARQEPPKIISIEPSTVDCYSRSLVRIVGRNLPCHRMIVKFGSLVMISGPIERETGSFMCEVPSISKPENTEIRISGDDDVYCIVRHYKHVDVSLSEDGGRFFPFQTNQPFTYERLEPPISVRQYLPRLQRIYVQYSTNNGKRPDDVDMVLDKWLQFCREFRLLPPLSAVDDDSIYANAMQLVTVSFQCHAIKIKDPMQVIIDGLKPKEVLSLDASLFPKAVISWIVRSGLPVAATLEEIMGNDLRTARERTIDVRDLSLGPQALRIRRAAKKTAVIRRPENANVVHTSSPRDARLHELFEAQVLPGGGGAAPGPVRARWANENDHNRMLERFIASLDSDSQFAGNIAIYRVESLPFHSTTLLRDEEPQRNDNIGASGAAAQGATGADEKEQLVRSVQNAITALQREQWNAALRREKAAQYRHSVQTDRLVHELQTERAANAEMIKKQSSSAGHQTKEDAPLLSAGSAGVLQAEKEELHRIFVYELEKRKTHMRNEMLRDEMMRDVERDRTIQNLREQITDSSTSFQRLQDVALGQAETVDKQADALRLLADRSTQLMADAMFFRSAHEKAIKVIAEDPNPDRAAISEKMLEERTNHILSMNQVSSQMLMEMKDNPAPKHPSAKELAKIPKQMKTSLPPLPSNYQPPALPKATTISVMLTAQEAEMQVTEAVDQVRTDLEAKMKLLAERLSEAEARASEASAAAAAAAAAAAGGANSQAAGSAGGEGGAEYDGVALQVPSINFERMTPRGGSRGSKARAAKSPRPVTPRVESPKKPQVTEIEVQTDAPTESGGLDFMSFGTEDLEKAAVHRIAPGDTFDTIAQQYNVPLESIFRANFVLPPASELTGKQRADELYLLLMGIASRTLRIPNCAGQSPAVLPVIEATVVSPPNLPPAGKPPVTPAKKVTSQEKKQRTTPIAAQKQQTMTQQQRAPEQVRAESRDIATKIARVEEEAAAVVVAPVLPPFSGPSEATAASDHCDQRGTDSICPFPDEDCSPDRDRDSGAFQLLGDEENNNMTLNLEPPPPLKPLIDLPNTVSVLHSVPSAFCPENDDGVKDPKKAPSSKKKAPKPRREQLQQRQGDEERAASANESATPPSHVDESDLLVRMGAAMALDAPELVTKEPTIVVHHKFRPSRVLHLGEGKSEAVHERREEPSEDDCRAMLVSSIPIEDRSQLLLTRRHHDFFCAEADQRLSIVLQAEKHFQGVMEKVYRMQERSDVQFLSTVVSELKHDAALMRKESLMRQQLAESLVARGRAKVDEARIAALRAQREADRVRLAKQRVEIEVSRRAVAHAHAKEKLIIAAAHAERKHPKYIPPIVGRSAILRQEDDSCFSLGGLSVPTVDGVVHEESPPRNNEPGSVHVNSGPQTPPPPHVVMSPAEATTVASPTTPFLPPFGAAKLAPLRMPAYLPKLAQDQVLLVAQAEDLIRARHLELAERRPHTDGELSPLKLKQNAGSKFRKKKV